MLVVGFLVGGACRLPEMDGMSADTTSAANDLGKQIDSAPKNDARRASIDTIGTARAAAPPCGLFGRSHNASPFSSFS